MVCLVLGVKAALALVSVWHGIGGLGRENDVRDAAVWCGMVREAELEGKSDKGLDEGEDGGLGVGAD